LFNKIVTKTDNNQSKRETFLEWCIEVNMNKTVIKILQGGVVT